MTAFTERCNRKPGRAGHGAASKPPRQRLTAPPCLEKLPTLKIFHQDISLISCVKSKLLQLDIYTC